MLVTRKRNISKLKKQENKKKTSREMWFTEKKWGGISFPKIVSVPDIFWECTKRDIMDCNLKNKNNAMMSPLIYTKVKYEGIERRLLFFLF